MQQNGLVGFLSLQIEIVVVGPPRPRHRLPTATTTPSLPFFVSISNDDSPPYELRRSLGSRFDGVRPGCFKGEDFWDRGDGEEEGIGKWEGWRRRRRRGRDGWNWRRRRRRYSEKGAAQDALWLFRVLRPYGWSLPLILLSWLAASGPKAFFISLALSFALSAVALLVQFLWPGFKLVSPGDDSMSKRSSVGRVRRGGMARGQKDEKTDGQKRESTYDSWLESDLGLGLYDSSFGGWADSEEERFLDELRQATEKRRKEKIASGKSRESLQEAEAEAPLLLRLLVAMFPFVASWTKLFW
ncbi:hypothetical protein MLD38_027223 [Melastoma candidum]|uniref:Uncharacterized protein n=1 Tax=Melastoma candidum TaxID=119954 RepID=A0ACB9P3V5_9MYRT|nr:hypothetical protein MLD38_027223 [Melastoma candidum]